MPDRLPLYAQLKEALIEAISHGELLPGAQLPSQRELCEKYGMSHMTVRRAINELISEGVIHAIPGKGIFVRSRKAEAEAGAFVSFTEDMARRGMLASSRVLAAQIVSASTMLARGLDVEVGTALVYLCRLRLADGEPMALQSSYLPHGLCRGLLKHDLKRGSLYAILRETYGLHLARSTGVVEAAMATEDEAALLRLSRPAAVLITERLTFLDDGQPVEFVRSTYRGDLYRLTL